MPEPATFVEFMTRLHHVDRTHDLWTLVLAFYRARGVAQVSYHHFGPATPNPHGLPGFTIAAEGFPEDWVARYLDERLWEADPIVRLVRQSGRTRLWRDLIRSDAVTPQERGYIDIFDKSPLGDGLAVPLAGHGLRQGYAGLGFGRGAALPTAAGLAELQGATQLAHIAYCSIIARRAAAQRDLSPRELEVLSWIVHGKSNGVIADILSVSRHTVDTLVRRIYDKLGVGDRTTAAIRAISLNITPAPTLAIG